MKRLKKAVIGTLVASLIFSSFGFSVSAATTDQVTDNKMISNIEAKIERLNKESNYGTLSLDKSKLNNEALKVLKNLSDQELNQYLQSTYEKGKEISKNIKTTITPVPPVPTQSRVAINSNFAAASFPTSYHSYTTTCSVSSAIPSIGVCTVYIDYHCTVQNVNHGSYTDKYFTSGNVLDSYQTGVAIASWDYVR